MTIFYLILYYIWRERYQITGRKALSVTMWVLTVARIALCAFPQNEWLSYPQPVLWGIIRNIPFAIMGILLIVLFAQEAKRANDKVFRFMWLAITLSFAFYLPVVLFAEQIPMIGMLMIPKTLAYVWVVVMGLNLYRQTKKTESVA
jgi:ABC-type iron transport system FetAB permease component